MTIPPQPAESAPTPPTFENIFPILPRDLELIHDRLLQINGLDLKTFVDVRHDGAPNNVLTVVYNAGLTEWHHHAGRSGGESADVLYEGGLLYGATLADTLHQRQMGRRLVPDDPDAYQVALGAVKQSHDYQTFLPYESLFSAADYRSPWDEEYRRERAYTGGGLLSVLNATLDEHLGEQVRDLDMVYGLDKAGFSHDEWRLSFYRGLVDAAIFCNSYARWRENGAPPAFFLKQSNMYDDPYTLVTDTYVRTRAFQDHYGTELDGTIMPPDSRAGVIALAARLGERQLLGHVTWTDETSGDTLPVTFARVLNLVGPNTFGFEYEVNGSIPGEDDVLVNVDPKHLAAAVHLCEFILRMQGTNGVRSVLPRDASIFRHYPPGAHNG